MSKAAISGCVWAEMSEAQRIETVREGRATLREMVEGLLDGPDQLREACRKFLFHTDVCLEKIQVEAKIDPVSEQLECNSNDEAGESKEESMPDDTQGG